MLRPRQPARRRGLRPTGALLTGLLLVTLAGCRARRELVFESEPPGAQVRLDGEIVGRTPLVVPFESYGVRHVSIQHEGHRGHAEDWELVAPWYSHFPLDYFSEVLLPFGWRDVHRMEVVLEPWSGEVPEEDFEAVLERAESLRRGGPAGPNQSFPAAGRAAPTGTAPTDEQP
jgi:hypothetical protein